MVDQVNNQVGEVDEPLMIQLNAHDPDGDDLTFTGIDVPPGAKVDLATGLFSWTPTTVGSFSAEVEVSDGCNAGSVMFSLEIFLDKDDHDGDGFLVESDCDDDDASVFPLKKGYNIISKSVRICDGTYESSLTLKGSAITVEAHQLGVFLKGGYLEMDGTMNSTVRNINVIDTSGTLTDGNFFTAGIWLHNGAKGNKLEFVSAACKSELIYTCDFAAFFQAVDNNIMDDCVLAEGKYSLALGESSDNNTISSTKFSSPENTWVTDDGNGNQLLNNEYL